MIARACESCGIFRRPSSTCWAKGQLAISRPFARAGSGFARSPRGSTVAEPLLMEAEKPPDLTNQGREPVAKGPMQALVAEEMHYIRSADGLEELTS